MNKELSKAIMIRTKMGNKFKSRSHENRENFNKQRNYCVQLVRKSKSLIEKSKRLKSKNTLSTGLFMWMLLNYGTMNMYTNFFVSIDFKTHISNFKIFAQ